MLFYEKCVEVFIMKKLLSIVLAAIMTVSVFALSVVPAFAADVHSPTASTATNKGPVTEVNGVNNTTDITFTPDSNDKNKITFVYTGEGTLKGWEHNMNALGFVDGTDYTTANNSDGSFTITFITDDAYAAYENGKVVVNALVDFGTATTAPSKKNDSSKSPATGLSSAVVAGSVAVACAGVAVLAATKKRDAE